LKKGKRLRRPHALNYGGGASFSGGANDQIDMLFHLSSHFLSVRYLFSCFFVDRKLVTGFNFVWKSKPSLYD
jgi:hypothetical protein